MDSSQAVHLPGFLHSLEPTLNHYGYLAVGGLVLLEDFGVPVPGETILILGAVFAGAGRLNVWLVGLIGFLAAVAGDNIGFAIGHFGGRALVERFGRYIFLTPERLDKTTDFFERHGGWIIVVARFIEGLRQANGIIAGTTGMHWAKFLAFNMLGAALWVAVWTSVGYFAGDNITSIYDAITNYTLYVAIGAGVLLLAWIARRVWRRKKRRALASAQANGPQEARATAPSEAQADAPREARAYGPDDKPQADAPREARADGPDDKPQADAPREAQANAPHKAEEDETDKEARQADPPRKEQQAQPRGDDPGS
jgi:membrane protein DedA with SNARE-associated domain